MIEPTRITAVRRDGPAVVAEADVGHFRFTPHGERVVHVAYFPGAEPSELPMWGLRPRSGGAPAFELETSDSGWRAGTSGASVEIPRDGIRCGFHDATGGLLTRLDLVRLDPVRISGEETFHVYAAVSARRGEAFYGLGQHQTDWMNQDHQEVLLWHDYKAPGGEVIAVPFMITDRGYGIVWDNPSRSKAVPGCHGRTLFWSEVGEAVSFFLIAGRTPDAIYQGYRDLVGATPMPPRSALGYIQCKQRYASQEELLSVGRAYREKGYPCDMLILDWFHWTHLGDMDLNPEFFPDPAAMNRELADLGFRVMVSCWPRFTKKSKHYERLEANGWFMKDAEGAALYGTPEDPRGALLDTTHPAAAAWFWQTIHESYGARGFSSWWLDENEPDINPHPYYLHAGTGARVHNLYPLLHNRALYEGHRRDREDRCLLLSRSAYHGAQTTGATFWSSDIKPTWDVFRRQIPCGLNFCASGFAYWSSDIGGWHALPQEEKDESYKELLIETADSRAEAHVDDYAELYVRWFQYGAFCPTFRAHGTRPENEVWSYGPEAERILVKYLKLRYRLMPYIYSLAWRTTQSGAPFMRALWMEFAQDPAVRDLKDEYMFGPAFLVAPVTEPGATTRRVYLPAGADWYDYWTGRKHAGGQTLRAEAPLETLPLFVRAGSVVPHGEVVEHTGQAQIDIRLHVYEGADAHFTLYRDDGITYAYEEGDYTLTPLAWDDASKRLTIESDPEGLFGRPEAEYLVRVG
jgi:alpha-D-xyloside xylohydrolase